MPAQDMLDVVHYFFESDCINTEEEHDAKQKLRGTLYNQLYQRAYTWGSSQAGGHEFGTQETASGEPSQLEHKPYVPPTPVNADAAKPFGNVLDAPLG